MMHSDAYTLCNLDSQTYSTLPAPYHHQQHYQPAPGPAYLHQNDSNYFQHATDCFRTANWASCGATSGHVVDSTSGESCVKRSRGSGGFYDGTAAMVLYGHHPGVARPPGAAAFEFPFPGFCAGADVASSNTGSGCGYAAAAAAAAFYGVDSSGNSGVLRSRAGEYAANDATLFYPGYTDQPPQPAHLSSNNGQHQTSIDLCSGAGSEFTALCSSSQRPGQPHSPTAVTANDQHRGSESNCTGGGAAQSSAATYKWMTVKRGAPKSTG